MKRLFDICFSLVALFFFCPVLLLISIIVKLDGGPIVFKQKRVGLNGKVFFIYKFRSMIVDADKVGGYSTHRGDPRITPVGKFLRKTSLDELPQFINVLFGDMSIVGPRPNVPQQQSEYTTEQWEIRNSVLPGITGLAQAKARSVDSWEKRWELDYEYVQKLSFSYDLKIIILTIKQLLFKGSY
ncbi:sugar transferase [Vibrio comitans]|uniref:sugar transferase n=1 Tax=Vibrio comitans TaxID=413401 RepID=UPI001ABF9BA0